MTPSTLSLQTQRALPSRRGWALLALALYLGIAALVVRQTSAESWNLLRSLPWSLTGALLLLSLANYALRAWRWIYLSRLLGLHVPAGANLLYYIAGYALTATPGKAGEAIRLVFLRRAHGIRYLQSLPLMLADRVLDVWAVLLIALAGLSGFAQYRWQAGLLAGVIAVVSVPFVWPARLEPLLRCSARRIQGRTAVRLRRMLRLMQSLVQWRGYGITLLPSALGWLAEGTALYLVLRHFGADVGMGQAVFVFCFGMIVGAISMLPGGLGSTEVAMVALLTVLGVGTDAAVVATAVVRLTTFWFAVLLGSLAMPAATRAVQRAAGRRAS